MVTRFDIGVGAHARVRVGLSPRIDAAVDGIDWSPPRPLQNMYAIYYNHPAFPPQPPKCYFCCRQTAHPPDDNKLTGCESGDGCGALDFDSACCFAWITERDLLCCRTAGARSYACATAGLVGLLRAHEGNIQGHGHAYTDADTRFLVLERRLWKSMQIFLDSHFFLHNVPSEIETCDGAGTSVKHKVARYEASLLKQV